MSKVTLVPPRCTPMDCARLMMRNHADPGLIAAYLALELDRDPTIAMTEWQRFTYRMRELASVWDRAWADIRRAWAEVPG